jgi:hypothetical protein
VAIGADLALKLTSYLYDLVRVIQIYKRPSTARMAGLASRIPFGGLFARFWLGPVSFFRVRLARIWETTVISEIGRGRAMGIRGVLARSGSRLLALVFE